MQSGRQLCFEITMLSGNTQILHVVCLMDSTGNPQIELFSKGLLSNHGNVKLTLPLYLHRCWNPGYRMKSFPCKRLFIERSLGLHVPHHARHGPVSVPLKIARASDDLNQEAGLAACFSRMRSRRVLVLRLGVWGLGVDAKFVRSVRKSPRPKIVAKRRTVIAFGLALGRRVSKVSTVSGSGGFRYFWTCVGSSRLSSVNSHRDRGGSRLRNAELLSLLDSRWVVASQKCRHAQDRGGVVTFGLASGLRVSKVSTVTGIGGCPGCGTQNCRHFWTRVVSSHLQSVNSLRDGGVLL